MNQSETPEIKAETQPTNETTQGDAAKRSKLPDFRPLGTVRDYFTELMKQDSIR